MRNAIVIIPRRLLLFAFLVIAPVITQADELPVDVVIVNTSIQTPMIQALSSITKEAVKEAFTECRQHVPTEMESFAGMTGMQSPDQIIGKAHLYGVRLIVYMRVFMIGPVYYCELFFKPLDEKSPFKEEAVTVQSTIAKNIPLKVKREIIKRHPNELRCEIKKRIDSVTYIINAGQWHGLSEKTYSLKNGKQCTVKIVKRYSSVVYIDEDYEEGEVLELPSTINKDALERSTENLIHQNIYYEHAASKLLKGESDSKRAIEACCIVNPFGNILLPGYGAFLATHYLGFTHTQPEWYGVYSSAAMVAVQLGLVPVLGKGTVNFFPWVKDADITDEQHRLHIYLWATLPLTYTVAFFNQLAYAYERHAVLPPFFMNSDVTSLLLSAVVPGGGLFYKGYSMMGHGYWVSEFIVCGFLVYNWDNRTARNILGGILAGIKFVELLHAYFVTPGYKVYSRELSHTTVPVDVGLGAFGKELCFYTYFSKNY